MSIPTPPPLPPTPRKYPVVTPMELAGMEVSASSSMPWPKKGREPVRLTPEEAERRFGNDADQSFHAHARDYVLRLVWTVRRLDNELQELKKRLGDAVD